MNMFYKLEEPAMTRNTNQFMGRQLGPKERRTGFLLVVVVFFVSLCVCVCV